MKERLLIKITENDYDILEKRINFLGATRPSVVSLIIYLYRDIKISKDQLDSILYLIKDKKSSKEFIMDVDTVVTKPFINEPLYFYTIHNYLSVLLHLALNDKDEKWLHSDKKQPKIIRKYKVDIDLANWLSKFSKKIGVAESTLLNYSLMFPMETYKKRSFEKVITKGFLLTSHSIENITNIPNISKEYVIDTNILLLKKRLDK